MFSATMANIIGAIILISIIVPWCVTFWLLVLAGLFTINFQGFLSGFLVFWLSTDISPIFIEQALGILKFV
jgi:hypothetical protein